MRKNLAEMLRFRLAQRTHCGNHLSRLRLTTMREPSPNGWKLNVPIQAQPTDTSCGPTCLQAIYAYYGDKVSLRQLIAEVPSVKGGGTFAVLLGVHALNRGYRATLYTSNLRVFDPSWFHPKPQDLIPKLRTQIQCRSGRRREAARAFLEFIEGGGEIRLQDLTSAVISRYLARGIPVLTGLSATFLYRSPREDPETNQPDDACGEPVGHFVVLKGYHSENRTVVVADPYSANPLSADLSYEVPIERLLNAILIGVLTYDGNLLIVRPKAQMHQSKRV